MMPFNNCEFHEIGTAETIIYLRKGTYKNFPTTFLHQFE
jgi:hypothetical protein